MEITLTLQDIGKLTDLFETKILKFVFYKIYRL